MDPAVATLLGSLVGGLSATGGGWLTGHQARDRERRALLTENTARVAGLVAKYGDNWSSSPAQDWFTAATIVAARGSTRQRAAAEWLLTRQRDSSSNDVRQYSGPGTEYKDESTIHMLLDRPTRER